MEGFCTGHGLYNSNKKHGGQYKTITWNDIYALVVNPPSCPKNDGQWVIFSNYIESDARSTKAQTNYGRFGALWVDIDHGDPTLATVVEECRRVLGTAYHVIHSTSSSGSVREDGSVASKWRILIPLAEQIHGSRFGYYQAALNNLFRLVVDRSTEQPGRVCFLPNRGVTYEHVICGESFYDLEDIEAATKALYEARPVDTSVYTPKTHGARSHVAAFNRTHSTEEMLLAAGFSTRDGEHWTHPHQTTRPTTYATQILPDDCWRTMSTTVQTMFGRKSGDAYDIGTALVGAEKNEEYAKSLLAAADALINTDQMKANIAAMMNNKTEEYDWNIDWPPCKVMSTIAQHCHATSARPVKQYNIAMAIRFLAVLCGRRYLVNDSGLNQYQMIIGESGCGKGESKKRIDVWQAALSEYTKDKEINKVFSNNIPVSAPGTHRLLSTTSARAAAYRDDASAVLEQLTKATFGSVGDQLNSVLTSIWDKGGRHQVLEGTSYSKQVDTTEAIERPALTLTLDIQWDPFKRALGIKKWIATGSAGRYMFVTRHGPRRHEVDVEEQPVCTQTVELLSTLWYKSNENEITDVKFGVGVKEAAKKFSYDITEMMINGSSEMLSRVTMIVNRLAAVMAVCDNLTNPVITLEQFEWAKKFVMIGYNECLRLMESGLVGEGTSVRLGLLLDTVRRHVNLTPKQRQDAKTPRCLSNYDDVITEKYLLFRLSRSPDFKGHETGISDDDQVRKVIKEAVAQDYLVPVTRDALKKDRGNTSINTQITTPLYLLGPAFGEE